MAGLFWNQHLQKAVIRDGLGEVGAYGYCK